MLKKLLVISVIFLVISVIINQFFFVADQVDDESKEIDTSSSRVEMAGVKLVGRHQNLRQWEITSEGMRQEGQLVHVLDIDEVIILQDEKPYFNIKAKSGLWERDTNNLYLYDEIEVRGDEFYLETEELFWDANKEQLNSPGQVQMLYEGKEIVADIMEIDVPLDKATLIGNVVIEDSSQTWNLQKVAYFLDSEVMELLGQAVIEIRGQDSSGN